MPPSRNSKGFVKWLGTFVKFINFCQIIGLIVTVCVVGKDELARDWQYFPRKPYISDIPFDGIFGLWIFCLVSGLVHNLAFDLGEMRDDIWLLKISIWIGIIKEIVRYFTGFYETKVADIFVLFSGRNWICGDCFSVHHTCPIWNNCQIPHPTNCQVTV